MESTCTVCALWKQTQGKDVISVILTKCLKQSTSEITICILQNRLGSNIMAFSASAFFFFNIFRSNIFVVSDKLILLFIQPFYNLLLMEVHNMTSPGVPIDQVNM